MRAGLEFTRKLNEVRELMDRYKASKNQDKEAADRVRALWKEIEPVAKEKENYFYVNEAMEIRNKLHPDSKK